MSHLRVFNPRSKPDRVYKSKAELLKEQEALAALKDLVHPLMKRAEDNARMGSDAGREPRFDIFRGIPGNKDAVWILAVEGLSNARAKTEDLAAQNPGAYFVFNPRDRSFLVVIDTGSPISADEAGAA